MRISLQGNLYEIPINIVDRSPYLNTLLNTSVGVEKDGDAYIVRDVTLSQFEAYIHYLNTGYLDDNSEELSDTLEFMGHSNVYELDIGRWYAGLRDEWFQLYDDSETGGLIVEDIDIISLNNSLVSDKVFNAYINKLGNFYYMTGEFVSHAIVEGGQGKYTVVVHADETDALSKIKGLEINLENGKTRKLRDISKRFVFSGKKGSIKDILYSSNVDYEQVLLDVKNNKLYMTHVCRYVHNSNSNYFMPNIALNMSDRDRKLYIDSLCRHAYLGVDLYLPMSDGIIINNSKLDEYYDILVDNIKELGYKSLKRSRGEGYEPLLRALERLWGYHLNRVINDVDENVYHDLELDQEELRDYKLLRCSIVHIYKRNSNINNRFVRLFMSCQEVLELSELEGRAYWNILEISRNHADQLLLASALKINAKVKDNKEVFIGDDIRKFYLTSTLI